MLKEAISQTQFQWEFYLTVAVNAPIALAL